jgi:hypothetical protein
VPYRRASSDRFIPVLIVDTRKAAFGILTQFFINKDRVAPLLTSFRHSMLRKAHCPSLFLFRATFCVRCSFVQESSKHALPSEWFVGHVNTLRVVPVALIFSHYRYVV